MRSRAPAGSRPPSTRRWCRPARISATASWPPSPTSRRRRSSASSRRCGASGSCAASAPAFGRPGRRSAHPDGRPSRERRPSPTCSRSPSPAHRSPVPPRSASRGRSGSSDHASRSPRRPSRRRPCRRITARDHLPNPSRQTPRHPRSRRMVRRHRTTTAAGAARSPPMTTVAARDRAAAAVTGATTASAEATTAAATQAPDGGDDARRLEHAEAVPDAAPDADPETDLRLRWGNLRLGLVRRRAGGVSGRCRRRPQIDIRWRRRGRRMPAPVP